MKNKFFNSLAKSASKHSPEIYTAIAVAGLLSAVGATVYATIKSQKEVKKAEEKKGDSLDKKEIIETCWKNYIPVVVLTILSAGCMCKSTSTSMKRTAALATLYNLSNTTLQEYKESVKEIVGDEKAREISTKSTDKKIEKTLEANKEVVVSANSEVLCCDSISGRYFKSTVNDIGRAVNNVNKQLLYDMYISLNEFYDELELPHTDVGDELGWNLDDGLIEMEYGSKISEDGQPCILLSYNLSPRYDYSKLL